jgi:hypothetical protein
VVDRGAGQLEQLALRRPIAGDAARCQCGVTARRFGDGGDHGSLVATGSGWSQKSRKWRDSM